MGNRCYSLLPLAPVAALAAGYEPAAAQAQAPAPAPAPADAPTREEVLRKPSAPLQARSGGPLIAADGIAQGPCPLSGPVYAETRFTLTGVTFAGLEGVAAERLLPAYQRHVGQSVPLAAICDIRDTTADMLRRMGYLAAVEVPPQDVAGGVVQLDVVLAKIVKFQVRGDAGRAEGRIAGYLGVLREQPVFNAIEAERALLLMDDMPGYDIRLFLRPAGTAPGEMIGEVRVNHTPVDASLEINNLGSRSTGRFGGLARLHLNGLLGSGDRTSFGFYSTADFKEQKVALAGEELRLGRNGLTVSADFAYAWTRPFFGPGVDFASRTFAATIQARYPLVRRQARSIFVSAGLDWVDQNGRFGPFPAFRDRLRTLYARADFDRIDAASIASTKGYSPDEPRWRFGGALEIRQGIGFLGNSKTCGLGYIRCFAPGAVPLSRLDADTTPFIVRASANMEFRPAPSLALILSPRAQFSPHPLLSFEEYSAGAYTIGRGYDPGLLTGDSGAGITAEARLGRLVPASRRAVAWQGYGFVDSAWLWNKDPGTPGDPEYLVSAGGGIRAAIGEKFTLETALAVPLKRLSFEPKRGDVRLLVNLRIRLLPWK